MAYIKCSTHGGNIASLVSEKVLEFVLGKEKEINIKKITYQDKTGKFYHFYVDDDFINEVQQHIDFDLRKVITSEETAFELSLELKPVCPICLRDKLSRIKN
ncbi:hypothetical protein OQJ68_16400 [Microbulbifer thermotolerans]|uniref:Uncharacterized protein n=1 Tax=Microbulbifer thermotolerans TaxID=252514 RepID=A0AB35I2R3_MICTH|nr:hypothetical protein [Microbulbifer thermotolerans]MCX2803359.1 hypothetical protein [Microbulbifer thermotolerans]